MHWTRFCSQQLQVSGSHCCVYLKTSRSSFLRVGQWEFGRPVNFSLYSLPTLSLTYNEQEWDRKYDPPLRTGLLFSLLKLIRFTHPKEIKGPTNLIPGMHKVYASLILGFWDKRRSLRTISFAKMYVLNTPGEDRPPSGGIYSLVPRLIARFLTRFLLLSYTFCMRA